MKCIALHMCLLLFSYDYSTNNNCYNNNSCMMLTPNVKSKLIFMFRRLTQLSVRVFLLQKLSFVFFYNNYE